jgi:hypothetical protein
MLDVCTVYIIKGKGLTGRMLFIVKDTKVCIFFIIFYNALSSCKCVIRCGKREVNVWHVLWQNFWVHDVRFTLGTKHFNLINALFMQPRKWIKSLQITVVRNKYIKRVLIYILNRWRCHSRNEPNNLSEKAHHFPKKTVLFIEFTTGNTSCIAVHGNKSRGVRREGKESGGSLIWNYQRDTDIHRNRWKAIENPFALS